MPRVSVCWKCLSNTLFQIQLYPPELDGYKHHIIETHVCPRSPDADELNVEVQGFKVKLTEIFHKAETPYCSCLSFKNVFHADTLCGSIK